MEADDRLDIRVDKVEGEVQELDKRVTSVEDQVGRITSHIESEVGLARNDLAKIDKKLFGEPDEEYGGKLGHISRKIYRMEVWFLAMICSSAILLFLFAVYQVLNRKP